MVRNCTSTTMTMRAKPYYHHHHSRILGLCRRQCQWRRRCLSRRCLLMLSANNHQKFLGPPSSTISSRHYHYHHPRPLDSTPVAANTIRRQGLQLAARTSKRLYTMPASTLRCDPKLLEKDLTDQGKRKGNSHSPFDTVGIPCKRMFYHSLKDVLV